MPNCDHQSVNDRVISQFSVRPFENDEIRTKRALHKISKRAFLNKWSLFGHVPRFRIFHIYALVIQMSSSMKHRLALLFSRSVSVCMCIGGAFICPIAYAPLVLCVPLLRLISFQRERDLLTETINNLPVCYCQYRSKFARLKSVLRVLCNGII